ncbi:pyrroloquinoline quinone-dependent dehydrogenase [Candidatus Sumerlaeota bacterium]|nr:pyrroloquinoline quinone-dependent dehydrogenase [Candidatus Sumerlaeota bacterium]
MNPWSTPKLSARNFAIALASSIVLFAAAARAQQGQSDGQWLYYSGDSGSTKYAALDQINKDNFKNLQIAWRWQSLDDTSTPPIKAYRFEPTPLMVHGVLYSSLSSSRVVALDAATGNLIWSFDPDVQKYIRRPTNLGFVHRGVAYWTDGKEERIFIGTGSAHMVAIDAKTGKACENFGNAGFIDLTEGGRRPIDRNVYAISSPPIVCREVVTVGSSIFDGPTQKEMPPGDIRGFDVRTGKELWNFHTIPQAGEFGNETWEDGSWEYTGNANCWTCISADNELGYFYIPIGTPTNDWYGGHRHGNGLFGESLVCLDAKTGKRIWHFQFVHHGNWDYDPPTAPVLMNIKVDGKPIKAVAQVLKNGFCYVFDRTNGNPVWPIEERPVPQSTVEGEKSSPTQPFPTKPAPFERQGVTEADITDFTPEIHAEAMEILKDYDYGPIFTPPTEKGTIEMPGWQGGANWGGAPFDPETGMMYVFSLTDPIRVQLGRPDPNRSNFNFTRIGSMKVKGPKAGTAIELPLFKPPYGRITAINMNTGDHAWMVAHGDGPRFHPALKALNLPPLGNAARSGGLVTKTLLIAAEAAGGYGAPSGDAGGEAAGPMMRAFDKKTGAILGEIPLPTPAGGSPMTYMLKGKQYIIVPVGGGKANSEFIAYALPG